VDLASILGISSFCITALLNGALFFHQKRSFDSIDQKIKELEDNYSELDKLIQALKIEIVRAEPLCKAVEEHKTKIACLLDLRSDFIDRLNEYIRKNDFIRDTQILTNQIETIHKKIDWIDDKMDRLREKTNA
jgi:hypothetical protein